MKLRIDWDEMYPYYFLHARGNVEVELTDAELELINRSEELFNEAQELLHRKRKEAGR
jgi:hypothetical protein